MISKFLIDPDWKNRYKAKVTGREEALSRIGRGARIFIGSACIFRKTYIIFTDARVRVAVSITFSDFLDIIPFR